jgi:hypothetical protein
MTLGKTSFAVNFFIVSALPIVALDKLYAEYF